MFSYNDETIHDSVELVVDGFGSFKMHRIVRSTLYCVDNSVVQEIGRHSKRQYYYILDSNQKSQRFIYLPLVNQVERKTFSYLNGETSSYLVYEPLEFTSMIYLVPGNPGLCEFYFDFIEALASKMPNTLIISCSYRGFDVSKQSTSKRGYFETMSLNDEVKHNLEFLDYILSCYPSVEEVALLGHSVGAYISQRIAVKHNKIQFVGLLTPTVHDIALSSKGKQFTRLQHVFLKPTVAFILVYLLLSVIPFSHSIVRLIVEYLYMDIRKEIVEYAIKLALSPAVVYQIVSLASEEMKNIGSEIEPIEIEGFWDRQITYVFFAENDHWVSDESRKIIIDYAMPRPNITTEVLNVSHAFCLKDSEVVAESVSHNIKKWKNLKCFQTDI